MTRRYVTLGDGRRVPLSAYVAGWKVVRRCHPAMPFNRCLTERWASTAGQILQQYRDGMHDRINRHVPGYGRGRKWSPDWQGAAIHCAQAVNTPRLVVRWVPRDLKARLAHRIGD